MYQVNLKGYFETENPEELIEAITNLANDKKAELVGQFVTYMLAPYVDYQVAEVKDVTDSKD